MAPTSAPTTWATGACTPTTFMDPSSTLFCVSTTITPSKETGCACPDGNIYERLSGGSSPCGDYIGGQSDLLEAIFLSCPAIDGGPSGVTSTASTIASSPTTGSTNCPIGEIPDGQAQDTCINTGTGTSPITGTGTGTSIATASGCTGTDQTDMTLTIVQPSLCKASDVQFSTKTAVPTGQLQISSDQTAGWGAVGSIWNFTLDDGATFSSLTAPCQGSTCTNLAGTTDIENAGTITKNSDGVWSLNVTSGMQPSIMVFGDFCGSSPVDSKVDLTITSTPPCALPIAQNCTNTTFQPTANQWDAYSVDTWLASYLTKHNIQDYVELYNQLIADGYTDTSTADNYVCDPSSDAYSCEPPSGTELIQDCTSVDATQGLLVLWAVMRISNPVGFVLHVIYNTMTTIGATVLGWVNVLVASFLVPAVKQKWEALVSAISSIVGILIAIFILIDVLTAGEAGPGVITGILVTAAVGITNILGAASNFANGFWTAEPDDTYLIYTGDYNQGIGDYTTYMQNSTYAVWNPENPAGTGTEVVLNTMKGGAWINVGNPLSIEGLQDNMNSFFTSLLGSSLINQIMKNNGWYVVFVPYGPVTDFIPLSGNPGTVQFTSDECNDHWANDPNRANWISCDLTYGTQTGMTVMAEPASLSSTGVEKGGGGSASLAKAATFADATEGFTFSLSDAVQSSLTGNSQHGFNYNYTTDQLNNDVSGGDVKFGADFNGLAQDTPGLYNLDVCVLTQLSYIPGARQFQLSNEGSHFYWYPNPCVCANFTSNNEVFSKQATPAVVNATTTTYPSDLVCTALKQSSTGLESDQGDDGGGGGGPFVETREEQVEGRREQEKEKEGGAEEAGEGGDGGDEEEEKGRFRHDPALEASMDDDVSDQ